MHGKITLYRKKLECTSICWEFDKCYQGIACFCGNPLMISLFMISLDFLPQALTILNFTLRQCCVLQEKLLLQGLLQDTYNDLTQFTGSSREPCHVPTHENSYRRQQYSDGVTPATVTSPSTFGSQCLTLLQSANDVLCTPHLTTTPTPAQHTDDGDTPTQYQQSTNTCHTSQRSSYG